MRLIDMLRLKSRTAGEFFGIFFAIFLVSIALFGARAATVIGASDTLTRAKIGTLANHAIIFTTPSGAPEGSNMAVTFPAEFGAAGMTENDVDLFDNGLPVTTAPDCSGVEQAAVAWVGNTLSFQICPGDGGAFIPGSTVTILIGTNAVLSGVGVNRLTNPAAAGSYRLVIGGSFGDSGFASVAISAEDSIGITACVGDVCNGTPPPPPPPVVAPIVGGGTGPGQTPPPQISDLVIDQITSSTARISWHTDIMSDSHILYGLTTDYGAVMGGDARTQDHLVMLMGLGSGLTYHIKARSVGYFGDVGLSGDHTFTTLPAKTSIFPEISDIRLESISGDEAIITWQTNVPTYYLVEFGRTASYGNEVENGQFDVAHEATLGNLSPATDYHFRIIAIDENGNRAILSDQTFTTFDTVPPAISGVHVENIMPHSADIVWNTSKSATGGVQYGPSASYQSGEALEAGGFSVNHRVTLGNLELGTFYHFKIFQTDRMGNDTQSDDKTFLTAILPLPPSNVPPSQVPKNAVAIGSGNFLLTVNNVPTEIVANVGTATPGSVIGLKLPDELTVKPIDNATVQVGDKSYKISVQPDGSHGVYFAAPQTNGNVPITVIINYKDGSSVYSRFNFMIAAAGVIYEVDKDQKIPIPGATVTILQNGIQWDGSQYGQNNTQTTDKSGKYFFYLPKGNYSLKIEKNGYISQITEIRQYDGAVSDSIKMSKIRQNSINFNTYWILLLILIILILFEISLYLSQKNSKDGLHT